MGAWTEIVDFTFTANETSRAFTGLSIGKGDFIKVVVTHVNGSSSNSFLSIFPNANTTSTNFNSQYIEATGTTVVANRVNNNVFNVTIGSTTATHIGYIKISENDRYNSFSNSTVRNNSSLNTLFYYATQSGGTSTSTITSLTFTSDVSNGLGTDSRIQIYRLDAEKVADITVASNTTQVDISSLSIGKDSEYLLVSDYTSANTNTRLQLFVNDDTTTTNYHTQTIRGNGSTATAFRDNDATLTFTNATTENLLKYNFIKLSEIGAYTTQGYRIISYGTTSPQLFNDFTSSTAENITSITKLNLVASTSNAITSGSRFILYKLK
jgi:hypothetical protein